MKNVLKQKTEEWMQLERKTLEQRRLADQYYDENLMKLIEKTFITNNRDRVFEKVEYLVMSVGTSYEPIVLNIMLMKPAHILFLYTDKSEITLEKVISYCGLKSSKYDKSNVNEIDPLDIYRDIKQAYLKWGKPPKMYIDITGGTKAMSSTAAMAGVMVDVQLVYVASDDYLVDFRKPNPGSERLIYIDNPIAVFGDLEIGKAFELFDKLNFSGAANKIQYLKESIPEPDTRQQLNFTYLLARAYEEWDSLNFTDAYSLMNQLKKEITRDRKLHKNFLLMDYLDGITAQEDVLEKLACITKYTSAKQNVEVLKDSSMMHALMFTMYQNAVTRERQEKYDMATLLLYRLLEMIEQRRLLHYGLYASEMKYEEIKPDMIYTPELTGMSGQQLFDWLKNRVFEIKKEMFGFCKSSYLPDQVALLEGFIILYALNDPITKGSADKPLNFLKMIRAKVSLRNNSIFAHGIGPVGKENYEKFKGFVAGIFMRFCAIEKIGFETECKKMEWLNPGRSRFYLFNIEESNRV